MSRSTEVTVLIPEVGCEEGYEHNREHDRISELIVRELAEE